MYSYDKFTTIRHRFIPVYIELQTHGILTIFIKNAWSTGIFRKNKGFTEIGKPSMVGRGGSISANFAKSAKPINSGI